MRYAQIREMDISNGEGIGAALYTSGCPFHCKNCFNKELWDMESGKEYTEETKNKILSIITKPQIKRFSILGGEPLIERNIKDLIDLISSIKNVRPDIIVWCYTGNIYEKIEHREILPYIDILVDGPFIDDLKDFKLKFRGSSNQRIIDVKKSLEKGEIILRK